MKISESNLKKIKALTTGKSRKINEAFEDKHSGAVDNLKDLDTVVDPGLASAKKVGDKKEKEFKKTMNGLDNKFTGITKKQPAPKKVETFSLEESLFESAVCEGNGWRGCDNIFVRSHGEWADPDLEWNDGDKTYTFNYWDIENALWGMFLEDSNGKWKDSDSDNPECEKEFDKYCQDHGQEYLIDVIDGGYFKDGSTSWHEGFNEAFFKKNGKENFNPSEDKKDDSQNINERLHSDKFIEALGKFKDAAIELSEAWENADSTEAPWTASGEGGKDTYPFEESFDEVVNQIIEWYDAEVNNDEEPVTEGTKYTPAEEDAFWTIARKKLNDEQFADLCKSLGYEYDKDSKNVKRESVNESRKSSNDLWDDIYTCLSRDLSDSSSVATRKKYGIVSSAEDRYSDDNMLPIDDDIYVKAHDKSEFAYAKKVADAFKCPYRIEDKRGDWYYCRIYVSKAGK